MFKFKRIASVLASAIMISSTVALAAAANYPAPFVKDGKASVAVVYGGSDAANTDLVASADISTSLSTELTKQTASSGVSTDTSSVAGGDFVKLEKSSDKFNLGNTMSGVFGSSVDSEDLEELLADGSYLNDENTEYGYEQRLTLQTLQLTHFADNDYNEKEPTVGFHIADSTFVLNYSLDFTTDAESDVSSSGDLSDFETTDLNILGKNYYILDAQNSTAAANFGKFTLLDSANTAIVAEGDTQTISVGDTSYEASINFISTSSVKLDINGQVTNSLAVGETYKLSDGTYVGVKDILYNSKDTGISKVEFSIGSGKLEIQDGNDIEFNDDAISGLEGRFVRGTPSGNKQVLDRLVIEWSVSDEAFITDNSAIEMPGFKAVKFSMGNFVVPSAELTKVNYDGDDSIDLVLPIKDGDATFNILYANATGEFSGIGKDATSLLRTSHTNQITFNESTDSWFVATYNTTSDAQSYLLSASIVESNSKNRTTIKNEVTKDSVCTDKVAGDTCDIGDVSLTIGTVYKVGSNKWVNISGGSNVNFNTVFTKTGLKVYLPYAVEKSVGALQAAKGAINLTYQGSTDGNASSTLAGHSPASYDLFFDEENKDDDKGAGKSFNISLDDDSDGDVNVASITANGGTIVDVLGTSDDTVGRVVSDLATEVKKVVVSDRGRAEITYSGSQAYAEVFVTSPSATVSGDGSTVGSIVPIMDTESSSMSGKNLIVVGGSCVNSVASSLLGSGSALCGADFTASTGVGSGQFLIQTFSRDGGKVATLVAGYNAGDTTNAAKYLTTQTVDTTVGMKYKGTTSTSAELVTA